MDDVERRLRDACEVARQALRRAQENFDRAAQELQAHVRCPDCWRIKKACNCAPEA